jgi:hypothetical protein
VLCLDPTLVTAGTVQTNVAYPIIQTPGNYDGPYADEACKTPLFCALVLFADGLHYITFQTDAPARSANQYVKADVNYEVHKNQGSYYSNVPNLVIANNTNANLSLRQIEIKKAQLIFQNPIGVAPNQSVSVNLPAYRYPGSSATITLIISSDIYISFKLIASYP